MGTKLPKKDNCIEDAEVLFKWLNHKDKNTSKPTWRTMFVSFPQIIPIEVLKEIFKDLIRIYKKEFPYSEKQDFIDAVFEYTLYDLKRFIDRNLSWNGEPPKEDKFTFYEDYDYTRKEFLDFGIRDNFGIENYVQYYRKVISIIENLQFDAAELSIQKQVPEQLEVGSNRKEVIKAFEFMQQQDPRKHKIILPETDFNRLITWVTFYFDNNFKLPAITEPIKRHNTNKGNVVYTFIKLFKTLHPTKTRPDSLFELIQLCFEQHRHDDIRNLKKQKEPVYYQDLIGKEQ